MTPDLGGLDAMATFGHLARLVALAGPAIDTGLEPYGLKVGEFDVLACLRRSGEPFQLTPTALVRQLLLSSGALNHEPPRRAREQRGADPPSTRPQRPAWAARRSHRRRPEPHRPGSRGPRREPRAHPVGARQQGPRPARQSGQGARGVTRGVNSPEDHPLEVGLGQHEARRATWARPAFSLVAGAGFEPATFGL